MDRDEAMDRLRAAERGGPPVGPVAVTGPRSLHSTMKAAVLLPLLDASSIPDTINGLPVIAKLPLPHHEPGEVPLAVVVCHDGHWRTSGDPWIVWYWVAPNGGDAYATEGGYHRNYALALKDLARRVERYSDYTAGEQF
jgi:hypothetical protein